MPDRHSTPLSPRSTTDSTRRSQGSPAPASTIVPADSRVIVTPIRAIWRTRPPNPSSAIPALLPPPRTHSGTFRAMHHWCAAATSSTCSALTNQRATPPTPRVLNVCSGTCSLSASDWLSEGTQQCLLRSQGGQRIGPGAALELDPVARGQLPGHRKVGGDHRGDLRISTRGLSIVHEQNRL